MGWTIWITIGGIWGGLAVIFGAFGAHALKSRMTPDLLQTFELATRYHMYHALGLLAVGLLGTRVDTTALHVAGALFIAGSLIFSGSLYILALTNTRWLGAITPIGGILLILGWFTLAYVAFALRSPSA
jgi:uncharacterized membrane protein YgdD (TMEM256/DUF423 family)